MDKETRRRNAEARQALRAERAAEEAQDKDLVLNALRTILQDQKSTPGQRLYAVVVLDHMKSHGFIPYYMKYKGNPDDLVADFAKRFEAAQKKDTE